MKSVPVLYGQTIIDIAVQELGDAGRSMEVANLNNRSLSDDLAAGEKLNVPDFDSSKKYLVQLFSNKANAPASADTPDQASIPLTGIDYWALTIDFIVQ